MRFLFLEFFDRELNYFINSIEEAVYGKKSNFLPHLTIRGPYKKKFGEAEIHSLYEKIKFDIFEIKSVSYFVNENEVVIYLTVKSTNLRKIWRKKDYPISVHGFSPHITVYKGENKLLANALYKLLNNYNIEFNTNQFRIIEYESKNPQLLSAPLNPIIYTDHLFESGKLPSTFLDDLNVLSAMRSSMPT